MKNEGGGAGLWSEDVRADIRRDEVLMLTYGWLAVMNECKMGI